MPLIDEDTAFGFAQKHMSMQPNKVDPLEVKALDEYAIHQQELGLPMFPSNEAKARVEKEGYYSVFTDIKKVDEWEPTMKQIAANATDPDNVRQMFANSMFLATELGLGKDEVLSKYQDYLGAYSQKVWGKRVADTAGFYGMAQGHVKKQVEMEEAGSEAMRLAITSAALGTNDSVGDYQKWKASNAGKAPTVDAHRQYSAAYNQVKARIEPYKPVVAGAVKALKQLMSGEGATDGTEQRIVDAIVDLPPQDRPLVLASIMAGATATGEGTNKDWTTWQQIGESFSRLLNESFAGQGSKMMDSTVAAVRGGFQADEAFLPAEPITTPEAAREFVQNTLLKTMQQSSTPAEMQSVKPDASLVKRQPTPEEKRMLNSELNRVQRQTQITRQIEQAAVSTDPVKNVFASAIGSSLAILPASAMGPGGVLIAAQAYSGMEYDKLRVQYPTMKPSAAIAISGVSGVVMAGLDKLEVDFLTDKLPSLRNLIGGGVMNSVLKRMGVRAAEGFVFENVQEGLQDLSTPVVQEIATRLNEDIPELDWNQEWTQWSEGRADVALGTLPLVLIGVGAAAYNDVTGAAEMLKQDKLLQQFGLPEADRVSVIDLAAKGDMEGAQAALRDAYLRRDPAIAAAAAKSAPAEVATQQFDTLLTRSLAPKYSQEGDTHTLTFPDGRVIKAESWSEARWYMEQAMGDTLNEEITTVAELANFFSSQQREGVTETTEFAPGQQRTMQQDVEEGVITEEQARERAAIAGEAFGLTPEEAQKEVWTVLGRNTVDTQTEVANSAIQLFEGADVNTVVEEVVEGRWKAALAQGKYSAAQAKQFIAQVESATGEKFLEADTDQGITEAISAIVVADVLGRRKDGTQLPAGLVTRGMLAAVQRQATPKANRRLMGMVAAFRSFFRQVFARAKALNKAKGEGKLGKEYQGFVDELLGVDPQVRELNVAATEARATATAAATGETQQAPMEQAAASSLKLGAIVRYNGYVGRLEQDGQRFVVRAPDQEVELSGEDLVEVVLERDPATTRELFVKELQNTEVNLVEGKFTPAPSGLAIISPTGVRLVPQNRTLSKNVVQTPDGMAFRVLDPAKGRITLLKGQQAQQAMDAMLEAAGRQEAAGQKVSYSMGRATPIRAIHFSRRPLSITNEVSQEERDNVFGNGFYAMEPQDEGMWTNMGRWSPGEFRNEVTINAQNPLVLTPESYQELFAEAEKQREERGYARIVLSYTILEKMESGGHDAIIVRGFDQDQIQTLREKVESRIEKEFAPQFEPGKTDGRIVNVAERKAIGERISQEVSGMSYGALSYMGEMQNQIFVPAQNAPSVVSTQPQTTYSLGRATPQDAEYLAAVERGDMETAQRMVDEAARAAGYNVGPVYHGTEQVGLTEFYGGWFSERKDVTKEFGSQMYSAFLRGPLADGNNLRNLYIEFNGDDIDPDSEESLTDSEIGDAAMSGGPFSRFVQEKGFQGIEVWDESNAEVGMAYSVFDPSQIKSADPVTRDDAGNVIPLSERFNPQDNRITYALAPAKFSEQVMTELEQQLGKDPAQRWAFGVEIQRRLAKLSTEVDAMAAADLTATQRKDQRAQFVREKFDELVAQMPPNQSVDELKKVMAQAEKEGDAWAAQNKADAPGQRERIIGYQRIVNAALMGLPKNLRTDIGGFLQVADARSATTALKAIKRHIERIGETVERYLKEEIQDEVKALIKRGKPNMKAGEKPSSDIGAEASALFQVAADAIKMDEVQTLRAIADREAEILDPNNKPTPERENQLRMEIDIINLAGDLKNADAAQSKALLDTLQNIYDGGYLIRLDKLNREKAKIDRLKDLFKAGTGLTSPQEVEAAMAKMRARGKGQTWVDTALLELGSFNDLIYRLAGENSEFAKELLKMERKSDNMVHDLNDAMEKDVGDFFTRLAGSEIAGQQLRAAMSLNTKKGMLWLGVNKMGQPPVKHTIKVPGKPDAVEYTSQMEAIHDLMMWRQPDGKRNMSGKFNTAGDRTSTWGYDDAWAQEVSSQLTPESWALMDWLTEKYQQEGRTIDPLVQDRYGVMLPQNPLYSPLTNSPAQVQAGQMEDPITGAAVNGSMGITPSSLKARNKSINKPRKGDALRVFMAHSRQMNHWIANYDFARTMQQLFLSREMLDYVEAMGGEAASKLLLARVDMAVVGGLRDSKVQLNIDNALKEAAGRAAASAILGRVSTLAVQSTQLFAASLKMPQTTFLRLFGKLSSGQLDWNATRKSEFIQRRIAQKSPLVQEAMKGLLNATSPSLLKNQQRRLAELLAGADAYFTAATHTMIYHHQLEVAQGLGMSKAEAEAYAMDEADRQTEEVAQPVRQSQRSLLELRNSQTWAGRVGWAFASEARQKLAIMLVAAEKVAKDPSWNNIGELARVANYMFTINGLLVQIWKRSWLLARTPGGDDEDFGWKDIVWSSLAAPMSGTPGWQAIADTGNLFSSVPRAEGPVKRMVSAILGEDQPYDGDPVKFMRDAELLLGALSLVSDTATTLSAYSHVFVDLAKLFDAQTED